MNKKEKLINRKFNFTEDEWKEKGKVCLKCGIKFIPIKNKNVFCSKKCSNNTLKNITCKICNKKVSGHSNIYKKEYCSRDCYLLDNKAKCQYCGKGFLHNGTTQTKYCSNECKKQYQKEFNQENVKNSSIRYSQSHKEEIKNRQKKYRKDPLYKIKHNLRKRLRDLVKGKDTSKYTTSLIGCTMSELRLYLESKFTDNMSWDNYGVNGWVIDHIKPCAFFDLTDPEQQKICFHYTNLQPLWWKDNLEKRDKLDWCA